MSPSIAIAIGANLGRPENTLAAVRPQLQRLVEIWASCSSGGGIPPRPATQPAPSRGGKLRWSPRFYTAPVGGPPQPDYINAALLLSWPAGREPMWAHAAATVLRGRARSLLLQLHALEAEFGRLRLQRWGPRFLDLDLLWVAGLACHHPSLALPHPRLGERAFVLAPLAAIDPTLRLPDGRTAQRALETCQTVGAVPLRLAGNPEWPE